MLSTLETFYDDVEFLYHVKDTITIDTETTGLEIYKDDRMVGISVYADGRSFYFAFRHKQNGERYPSNLPEEWIAHVIRMLDSHATHTYFNATFDLHVLLKEGMCRPEHIEDVMIAAHLMNENEKSFQLKQLADKYVHPQASNSDTQLKSLLKSMGLSKGNISQLDPKDVTDYAEDDVILTRKLKEFYVPYLRRHDLYDLWVRDNEFLQVLNTMERRGMLVDRNLCWQYLQECGIRADEYKFAIQEILSTHLVNPRSSQQMQNILKMPSANRKALMNLLENEEGDSVLRYVAKNVMLYRLWTKADTTYYLPYLRKIDSENVLHPNFNIIGTVSGRLSSNNPNMTAVPRERDEYKVKDVFIARPGYILLDFDLSQAEMRVASHYANEKRMTALLNAGEDIHQDTANAMGISRHIGKTLNFAVLYRAGVSGLMNLLPIEEYEAKTYLKKYHETYPGFNAAAVWYGEQARNQGYVRLFTGRRRRFYTVDHGAYIVDHSGPHKAFNSIIQGTVAEIMRINMLNIYKQLTRSMDVHMLLQVHDSLLFEVPEQTWKECAIAIKSLMEKWQFNPRITVEGRDENGRIHIGKVGHRWGKMQKIYLDELRAETKPMQLTA